jgi:thiamine pyrophosphate-dependent acetolactate synthase large subunit-like protein
MLCNRNKNDFEDIAKSMGATGKNVGNLYLLVKVLTQCFDSPVPSS